MPTVERELGAPRLLEGDRRRQAGDVVDLGHAGLVQQATGVRRHRLEVPPLRLRVDRAERQGRLARAGDAGEGDKRIARDVDVHVPQVVLAGATHADERVGSGTAVASATPAAVIAPSP